MKNVLRAQKWNGGEHHNLFKFFFNLHSQTAVCVCVCVCVCGYAAASRVVPASIHFFFYAANSRTVIRPGIQTLPDVTRCLNDVYCSAYYIGEGDQPSSISASTVAFAGGRCVWQGHCGCITVHWFRMIHAGWGWYAVNTDRVKTGGIGCVFAEYCTCWTLFEITVFCFSPRGCVITYSILRANSANYPQRATVPARGNTLFIFFKYVKLHMERYVLKSCETHSIEVNNVSLF